MFGWLMSSRTHSAWPFSLANTSAGFPSFCRTQGSQLCKQTHLNTPTHPYPPPPHTHTHTHTHATTFASYGFSGVWVRSFLEQLLQLPLQALTARCTQHGKTGRILVGWEIVYIHMHYGNTQVATTVSRKWSLYIQRMVNVNIPLCWGHSHTRARS